MEGYFIQAAIAFVAAFAGAFFAFMNQNYREKRLKEDQEFAASKKAQFALSSQINTVLAIKKQHLDKFRDDDLRFIHVLPILINENHLFLDIDSLMFMLDGDTANLIQELDISEKDFTLILNVLSKRNRTQQIFQEAFSELERRNIEIPNGSRSEFMNFSYDNIGKANVIELESLTNELYEKVDKAMNHYKKMMEELEGFIKTKFPKRKKEILSLKISEN